MIGEKENWKENAPFVPVRINFNTSQLSQAGSVYSLYVRIRSLRFQF